MSKINISFNNTNYSIDESALSTASAALASHLSTVMNGSGATINLGGTAYNIDSAKLSAATNSFVSHLGTIAGDVGGSDTLYWDGNTEGHIVFADSYIHVSDATPTMADFANGFVWRNADREKECSAYAINDLSGLLICDYVTVVPYDDFTPEGADMSFAKKGVYLVIEFGEQSLTIPGYTGFEHSESCGH